MQIWTWIIPSNSHSAVRGALAIVNSWQQIEHFHSETGKLQSQDPDTEIIERQAGRARRDLFFEQSLLLVVRREEWESKIVIWP